MTAPTHSLRLILGDQLNPGHSWFAQVDPQVAYVMMEVRQETDYVLHHAQKILAIFAAMRDFADQLRAAGHRVRYVALDNPSNRQSIPTTWRPWLRTTAPSSCNGSSPTNGDWTSS